MSARSSSTGLSALCHIQVGSFEVGGFYSYKCPRPHGSGMGAVWETCGGL